MSDPAQGPSSSSSPVPFDPHRGERIGRYEVLSQLSVGGMAELFLGYTSGPGGFRKYAAIKRILPDARSDEQFERMFLDEARITAAFSHPNIGQVFELGQDPGGLFLAMEFIAGQNLDQVIALGRRLGGTLPLGFVLSVVRDVCLALHYAHTFTTPGGKPHPVIHRDVAHKNVMVTYDGVVKLLDFGIAKARGARANTQAGMVKGTTGYMSPEQVRGQPLDGRSDLFSVGVMLHELLTGERLFAAGSEIQEMQMILGASIPEPQPRGGQVPAEIRAVALKALARDREQRYATGRDMARALEAVAGSLLFDAEQRAAFMAEHFQKQREGTRQLLQTVDETLDGTSKVAPVASSNPAPEPARVLEDARRPGVEKRSPRSPAPRRKTEPEVRTEVEGSSPDQVVTTGRVVTREFSNVPAAPPDTRETPGPKVARSSLGLWAGMLVLGGLLGLGGMELRQALHAEPIPAPAPDSAEDPSPLLPLGPSRPQQAPAPAPEAAATPTSPPAAEAAKAPASTGEAAGATAAARPAKQGFLTLVTRPEAEVFLNGRSLGKTPLFKKPVPVGQLRLLLQGPDGKRRELFVPVEQGKPAVLNLPLADLPVR
ncbi:serine/threonine protein kinase [Cystobacter fuscus DSM 2262]|uniref:Serine/threonine protein kinase n=1 Tax=Cystobacter fuscus (strain ATCC 25194 / DSM 2262 / NBRC 100088 / M29) TaxID=1242864 RepID=S9PIL9_CYSF2|nr:serine/threonine-protein kinase [Cystobacter fuscus]EPX64150.1 serine/threonine protein kinase [Cystobacter fuscus DSM 2262]